MLFCINRFSDNRIPDSASSASRSQQEVADILRPVSLCALADEQMYRCEDCDELFSSTLELRRHQKYSCTSTGSIFDTLREDFKQEREDSDEPVHECKDCEKIFPNEYRYADPSLLALEKLPTINTRRLGF